MRCFTPICRTALAAILAVPLAIPLLTATSSAVPQDPDTPWARHAIVPGLDGAGNADGADGVDTALVDRDDQLLDVAAAYEEGQNVTISFNPGAAAAKLPWTSTTIELPATGSISGPEDVTFADVDHDGAVDLMVGAEGAKRIVVFFAPSPQSGLSPRIAANWLRVDIQASVTLGQRSMRVQLADLDEDGVPEIVVGGKEEPCVASVGYYSSTSPRDPNGWTYHELAPAGWVMQLQVVDLNADGHLDIVYTDRDPINHLPPLPGTTECRATLDKSREGLRWLRSSGGTSPSFTEVPISPVVGPSGERYHKWFSVLDSDSTLLDWNRDGETDIADCRADPMLGIEASELQIWLNGGNAASWTKLSVPYPGNAGYCQHLIVADIDADGVRDLAFTNSHAGLTDFNPDTASGVLWLRNTGTEASPVWERNEIGGIDEGIKYDNLVWLDLDDDGDLDALTSEQHEPDPGEIGPGLGVIWYENPRFTS